MSEDHPIQKTSVSHDRPVRHLNQIDLSRRWNISARTLERWRWLKVGPEYLKLGGHVVYRLEDIERYEARQVKNSSESSPALFPSFSQARTPR